MSVTDVIGIVLLNNQQYFYIHILYFEVLNNADIKIATLIILTTLTVLGMLHAYPTITIYAQQNMTNTDQNMTNTDQNMTNTDQNMTELGYGTISGAARGTN